VRSPGLSLLLSLALVPGCVAVSWTRDARQSPPPARSEVVLVEGSTRLHEALAMLGAPLAVYEYRQTGMALAWGWYRGDSKGLRVSVPVYEQFSASVDYTDNREGLRGMLLLFDRDLRLSSVREGWLEDLTQGLERQSPTVVDDIEEDAPSGAPPEERR
jgi:hypothetical protein